MNQHPTSSQQQLASAALGLRHVFVKKLAVSASIGIHPHERSAKQTILISLDAAVTETHGDTDANLEDVVCYESMTKTIRSEERRVGKKSKSGWTRYTNKHKRTVHTAACED